MPNNSKIATPEKRSRIRGQEGKARFREQLLAEAKDIYSRQGYEAVSVRAVTKAVGISPMAFYGYFVSKQDLVKHIWLDFFCELFECLKQASNVSQSPVERLKAHVDVYLDYWERHPERYRMVYLSTSVDDERERIVFDEEDVVAQQLLSLTRERVSDCACGRPIAAEQVHLHSDLVFLKALGYLHGVLTVGRYPFSDLARMRGCLIDDIVDGVVRATAA